MPAITMNFAVINDTNKIRDCSDGQVTFSALFSDESVTFVHMHLNVSPSR